MQTWALLMDSYRLLKSRKLFWVTLGISMFVVLLFGSVGFDSDGLYLFFGLSHIDSDYFFDGSPLARVLYRGIFSSFIVSIWLAWAATILALIATSNIFPDFMAGGSIDMVLSKPIGRVKVFVVKYLVSLLFVLLQVAVFCLGVFLCMGLRVGDWSWKIFLAIPIITVFYSYLFSVTVFFGVRSRSAMNALLFTLLLWFGVYLVNQADAVLGSFRHTYATQVEWYPQQIKDTEEKLANWPESGDSQERVKLEGQLERKQKNLEDAQGNLAGLVKWHDRVLAVRAVFPKTADTIGLMRRSLKEPGDIDLMDLMSGAVERTDEGEFTVDRSENVQAEAAMRAQTAKDEESLWFVIGTSIAFELVVLSLACRSFVRRDF